MQLVIFLPKSARKNADGGGRRVSTPKMAVRAPLAGMIGRLQPFSWLRADVLWAVGAAGGLAGRTQTKSEPGP